MFERLDKLRAELKRAKAKRAEWDAKVKVYIGLTVKCIDYLQHGLPILNNIKGDTWALVEEHKAGFNIEENTIVDANELIRMRFNNRNIYDLFEQNFTETVFLKKCRNVIDEVMK